MGKFKVGDRVEVIYGHSWNGLGVVGLSAGNIICVDMKTGQFAGKRGGFEAKHLKPVSLIVETGKFYRTRDGRKVGPMVAAQFVSGFYDGAALITSQRWEADGSFIAGFSSQLDLIAEWIDEPVAMPPASAQVDTLAEEYGPVTPASPKPKFKMGDRVRFTDKCDRGWWFGPHTKYLEGEIVNDAAFPGYAYSVVVDNLTAYINDEHAEVISPTYTSAIVCLIENGHPKPARIPHVHASLDLARREANRLANKYKGDTFGVYVLTGDTVMVSKPAYAHEWQRQAANGNKIGAIRELRSVSGLALKSAKDAVEYWLDLLERARAS